MPDALIWGASGGIGGALAQLLHQQGWRVFAAARDETKIPQEANFRFGFSAENPTSIEEVSRLVAQETDGVDLAVYAAGSNIAGQLERLSREQWAEMIGVNLTGAYLTAQASLNVLKPDGHIMVLGAYVDSITLPKMGAYAVAKAGLEPLIKVFQKENRKQKFTLVRPPAVDTAFWENVPFRLPANAVKPEAVAAAILEHYNSGSDGDLDL